MRTLFATTLLIALMTDIIPPFSSVPSLTVVDKLVAGFLLVLSIVLCIVQDFKEIGHNN